MCRGLVHDAYSLSADDCRESCCVDIACEVYQFAEPVDSFANFGVGCWRGRPTTCDGTAHNGVLGGLAGRRTTYAQVPDGQPQWTGQLGSNGSATSIALANKAPSRLSDDGVDSIAYAVSGAAISCLLAVAVAAMRRRRLLARRVIPVTKAGLAVIEDAHSTAVKPAVSGDGRREAWAPTVDVASSRPAAPDWREQLTARVGARGRRVMPVVSEADALARQRAAEREQAHKERMQALWKLAAARRAEEMRVRQAIEDLTRRNKARVIQKRFREHRSWRDMVALQQHYAAVRIQVHTRDRLSHKHQSARTIQQRAGVRLKEWSSQREQAYRLMSELSVLLETTREKAAESTFAPRFDAEGRDIDEASDEDSDHPMEDFLDELRRDVGLPAPAPIHAEAQRAETPPLPTCRAYKEATPSVLGWPPSASHGSRDGKPSRRTRRGSDAHQSTASQ